MRTKTAIEHVTAACTVLLTTDVVDAGGELALRVKAATVPSCDLEGEIVELEDADGAVLASVPLGAFDEEAEANLTEELRVEVPREPGEHQWSVRLAAHEGDEVSYDEATAPVAFTVRAHATSLVVWDVPTAVVPGEPFKLKVGVKCSSDCRQAHRRFTIVDERGEEVAASAVGAEVWPKSTALYFTELELSAPPGEGVARWEARCAGEDLAAEGQEDVFSHASGSVAFDLRRVKAADFKVRVEAWDAEKKVPLKGARVVIHPYSAVTDEGGLAELKVARGHYRLFVAQTKYTTFGSPLEVAGDIDRRIELSLAPPPNRE
jgi:hypothetical protein